MRETYLPFRQRYRINTLRLLGALAFSLLAVTASPPAVPFVTTLLETSGLVAIVLAVAGRAWSLLYIGDRKNSELVTCGPYSVTRNPLYLFSLIGIAGIGAQTGSMLSMVIITATAYITFDFAMRGEERYLASRFGRKFVEYRELTPRLVPDFSLWHESEDIPLRSAKSLAGLKDGIVFVVAWASIELIKAGQADGILPIFVTLPL
ncbi:phospholipid methyltransferase protein [Rhizobium gallicum]|uniref:Phospholipid methyltransferase protein n=1 Tax=Rhizobium gallicum TaxID=56730 RepID=A0A1L5NM30_9HYPH|nr:isoprenylcysteine carboxylmethyltransferase family protein [Rhizobium gallicum]APO68970.1 phospholipid methyltransferase protein [Rhizobium gallicum]